LYREFQIFLECLQGQPVYPDSARSAVAAATRSFDVDPLIFNRQPDGKTVQGCYGNRRDNEGWGIPPLIVFGGGIGCIRIIGLGLTGSQLLSKQAHIIATALSVHYRTLYKFKMYAGMCSLARAQPKIYHIRELVISKKNRTIDALKSGGAFTLDSVAPLIRRSIIGGLISQARFLDESSSQSSTGLPFLQLESQIGTDETLGLALISGKPAIGQIKTSPAAYALIIKHLKFAIDLEIGGPWYSGHLRSKGMGRIRKHVD
jgi:hypothetical protein